MFQKLSPLVGQEQLDRPDSQTLIGCCDTRVELFLGICDKHTSLQFGPIRAFNSLYKIAPRIDIQNGHIFPLNKNYQKSCARSAKMFV